MKRRRVGEPMKPEIRRFLRRYLLWVWIGLTLVFGYNLGKNVYLADRFAHHSATVDAELVERIDMQCIFAGSTPWGSGRNIWRVSFPTANGVVTTTLVHRCNVIPPDFGRGRGYMWIQYDVDHPERTRVLTDTFQEDSVKVWLTLMAVATAAYVLWRIWDRGRRGDAPLD